MASSAAIPPPGAAPPTGESGESAAARARYDAFVRWLLENGAQFPRLELRVRCVRCMGWGWVGVGDGEEGRAGGRSIDLLD